MGMVPSFDLKLLCTSSGCFKMKSASRCCQKFKRNRFVVKPNSYSIKAKQSNSTAGSPAGFNNPFICGASTTGYAMVM